MSEAIMNVIKDVASNFSVVRLVNCFIAILVTVILLLIMRSVYRKYKKSVDANDLDSIRRVNTVRTIYRVAKVVVVTVCVIVILQINGINITSIVLLLSVIAAVVAVGVKDMFQDFFAGYVIVTDNYFKVGDAVEYKGRDGIVIAFTARSTKIELLDDRSVLAINNRNITEIRKLNHLVDIDLPLSYDIDRKDAFKVLNGICEQISVIEGVEKCELKGTQNFGESAIIYKIRFFCEPNDRPDIRRAVLKTIQDGLSKEDIHIPYTQLDIHQK